MQKLPVLLYNKMDPELYYDLTYRMDALSKQVNFLKDQGYQSISCKELIDHLNQHAELLEKPILSTFDGGYAINFELPDKY